MKTVKVEMKPVSNSPEALKASSIDALVFLKKVMGEKAMRRIIR